VPAPTKWLKEQGISRQLLDRYKQYNWITRVAKSLVQKKGDQISWEGAVYALENLQGLDIWIGGKTALNLKGLSHYSYMNKIPTVWLYSQKVKKLPRWVKELPAVANFKFKHSTLFSEKNIKLGCAKHTYEKLELTMSAPEKAILEVLDDVPQKNTFQETQLIFENLTNLRPKLTQELLEDCRSIKAKRLFLYFAEKSNHSWFKKIDSSKINLGKGKRAIVPMGKLNHKYQILVPAES